ncbi:MAG: hypothetical protein APF82_01765 [Sphingomonadales bacterium BRH_c42]|nr:MAG: hypothetical protein APF82_01765 [Sphingomonadales bacterium BRH_c42]
MARKPWMPRIARWHIWLGWVVGIPILMWMVTGLFMVARPIEEVRGTHLRKELPEEPLVLPGSQLASADMEMKEMRAIMQDGRPVAILTAMDGTVMRVDMASGAPIPAIDAAAARRITEQRIEGGERVESVRLFAADEVPFDFRREMPVWQVTLDGGVHVYIGRDTGEIEAVRTRWWRAFDFMWGLHILDPQTREDTSHPLLIALAALGTIGALLGCVLMFRRRKAKVAAP